MTEQVTVAVKQQQARLRTHFGDSVACQGPLSDSGSGLRITGVDLCRSLNVDQVEVLLDALSQFRIVCIAGQDLARFSLAHFERFANHWGAPVPHPNNFMRGGKPAQSDGDTEGPIELIPFGRRTFTAVNSAFPDQLQCLPHESPTVLVVANFRGRGGTEVGLTHGGSWHTDIEYEPLPIYVSMFLCHYAPTAREETGNWVPSPDDDLAPYLEGSDAQLMRLRKALPLNGETAFADTAAAFDALPVEQQRKLEGVRLRRRLNEGDEGWLAPLVRTNPRTGIKSLHSPIWASRPRVRPAVEVDGRTMEESRAFLDRLEAHVLQPRFRYDHPHVSGDVTLWDNYMTLHNSPPIKVDIQVVEDARLLYRLSCKGEPSLTVPRQDPPDWLAAHIAGGYRTPDEIVDISDS
ncbi:MAG: TauD/TfdA family dioxygenase [Candidatus Latescibacterota bacterium]|nr:TauD/TfdA family dioxygenase [Candidatus Latescibacterota bacterium]